MENPSHPPDASTLADEIRHRIAQSPRGISFAEFMELALYHPDHGYYSRPQPIGQEGDFFTSVSVGPCFGFLLARQIRQIHEALGAPTTFSLVEQGAHSGQLTRDLLAAWPDLPCRLVEPLPLLREFQNQTLRDVQAEVRQVSRLTELQEPNAVFLGNELLDAFPVRRLHFTRGHWEEWRVCQEDGALEFRSLPIAETDLELPDWLPKTALDGFSVEVCPSLEDWVRELSTAIERGVALLIDYGLTRKERLAPERRMGTVRAYRDHQIVENPLERPGETDITCQVDFSGVIEHARAHGWEVVGFTDQARFLTGIAASWLRSLEGRPDHPLIAQFKTLTHPGIMGRDFKVLALAKNTGPLHLDGLQFTQIPRS